MTTTVDHVAGLPIQEVARRTGFSESTLRYYERIGLVGPVPRDRSSSHRRYSAQAVGTLESLACLRSTGMSIEDMRAYLEGVAEGGPAAPRMAEGHRPSARSYGPTPPPRPGKPPVTRLETPFGFQSTTSDVLRGVDLSGQTALVTGGNAGIGYETARALASAGAAVVVGARRDAAGRDAAAGITESTDNPQVSHVSLDLADPESVARVVSGWNAPLHILVNNAGIMAVPELTRTVQGHELQFATNYLGHFALTLGLHDALADAGGARIVSLSSNAHLYGPVAFGVRFRPYDPGRAYAESKTAAVLLAVEATRRWAGDGIYANAVNPGAIATGLQKHTGGLQTPVERRKSVEQGAATSVFLAASPRAARIGGRYFEDVSEAEVRRQSPGRFGTGVASYALDLRFAELLWDVATAML